jgi:hypothetical protein
MIAFDSTLTALDMAALEREALNSHGPCGRQSGHITAADVVAIPEPHYNPDDPDNPMLDIILPSVVKADAADE